jgi:hypothetical protein
MSFLESVLHNFNKAAALTGLSEPQIGTRPAGLKLAALRAKILFVHISHYAFRSGRCVYSQHQEVRCRLPRQVPRARQSQ